MTQFDPRLRRRLLVVNLVALGSAGSAAEALAQGTKSGPRPPQSGLTDADPGDQPGNGRGGNAPRPGQQGQSDADPNDPAGQGRGGNAPRGQSDSDPSDPPGQGRGGARPAPAGPTDNDPNDPPGRGRGGRPEQKGA